MRWYICLMVILYACVAAVSYARSHPARVIHDYDWAAHQLAVQRAGGEAETP